MLSYWACAPPPLAARVVPLPVPGRNVLFPPNSTTPAKAGDSGGGRGRAGVSLFVDVAFACLRCQPSQDHLCRNSLEIAI